MITRGHFIGQVIDELTAVSQQVKSRAGLQLMDLNRYLEDFFKDVLNITLGCNLINLNEERSNNPGLDLGDEAKGLAFQITSTKTSDKVNETLKKAVGQKGKFPTVHVLILQDKQGSYTLDPSYTAPFGFAEKDHIWDIGDVLKKVLSLPIDRLQRLNDLINKEVARVKIELEVPDKYGKYQTNIDSYIEQIPRERFEGISSYYSYYQSIFDDLKLTQEIVQKSFDKFVLTLKKLPRITRQFYAFLLERSEAYDSHLAINADYLDRICRFPDMKGELRLLEEQGLCWIREPDEPHQSANWIVNMPHAKSNDYFITEILEFVKERQLSLDKFIVSLDFSDFK